MLEVLFSSVDCSFEVVDAGLEDCDLPQVQRLRRCLDRPARRPAVGACMGRERAVDTVVGEYLLGGVGVVGHAFDPWCHRCKKTRQTDV
ncbi:hypothetical protein BRC64_04860 [Halobacteriales archaeon QH_10_67_22]|nr:MAG: hypothetical protein BRC64_04860 [Halobacteriales archaeon QH_10_67_22]